MRSAAALAALALAVALPAAGLEVPYLAGRVVDQAGLLDEAARQRLESRLAAIEAERGAQIAVLTIPSLEGEVLEDYSLRVAETWKLGREQFDDGALLLVARDDRKMRLEVGYGLEPTLTDLTSRRILDDVMAPRFRQGDFAGGIEAAVTAIDGLLAGSEDALPPPTAHGAAELPVAGRLVMFAIFLVVVGSFSLVALATPGCAGWFLYVFLMPFWLVFPFAVLGVPIGLVPLPIWAIGYPILRPLVQRGIKSGKTPTWGWLQTGRGDGWSSRGGWGGFSGGGGGGGGFSGGGGGFGGGGSSSGW